MSQKEERIYGEAQGAAIENVLENPQSRKDQLYALHVWLLEHHTALLKALSEDLSWTTQEATDDLNAILFSTENLYNRISLQHDLAKERSVAKGAQLAIQHRALGLGLIIGSSRSPLSSVLLPVIAALAAGTITVVILSAESSKTSTLIRQCLTATTYCEAVHVWTSENTNYLQSQHFDVISLPTDSRYDDVLSKLYKANPSLRVLRPSKGKAFSIVDRSADLGSAAAYILRATSTSLFTSSLRVPKVCLVDEFAITELEKELGRLSETIEKGSRGEKSNQNSHAPRPTTSEQIRALVSDSSLAKGIGVLKRDDEMSIDTLKEAVGALTKSTERLVLVPTTSTENAIDLVNSVNYPDFAPVLYVFSKSPEGAYFSKFVRTQQTLINTIIPKSLTVEVPNTASATLDQPYDISDFATNSPVYQAKPLRRSRLPQDPVVLSKKLKKVRRKEYLPFSFFERGIVLGLVMILGGIGGLSYGGVRAAKGLLKM